MLVEHLERWLGEIVMGWRALAPDGEQLPFQVVRHGSPVPRSVAYATLGLNRFPGGTALDGHPIRQELLLLLPDDLPDQDRIAAATLSDAGLHVLEQGPLLRGEVLHVHVDPLVEAGKPALYVTGPVYLDDAFAVVEENGHPVMIAWLVPISAAEHQYVVTQGWDAFEDVLVARGPALVEVRRPSVV